MNVTDWLDQLGLPQYRGAFAEHQIDAEVLKQLTSEDLKELGVGLLGHRRKLLSAIEALRTANEQVRPSIAAGHGAPPDTASISPERRHLTVLFCDLVGSTALSTRLDPEELRDIIRSYHAAVAEIVRAQGGFVAQYLGDGALVYFGFPVAHEDDAERAVRTALLLRDGARAIEVKGTRLEVRSGLATGLVVVADRAEGSNASHEPQVMGETPNRAARLQGLAAPGGIVIDAATRKLVGRMFELDERGPATLQGFEGPVISWSVLGSSAMDNRFEALRSSRSPLVGRSEEIEFLERRWQQAKSGKGWLVMIAGESGLGKSRLVSAFQDRIKNTGQIELRYFCSPQHTSTPLYPIATQLMRDARFKDTDTPERKLEKLRPLFERPEDLPFIADLLGLPVDPSSGIDELAPQQKRERLLVALGSIESFAQRMPMYVLIEDMHWADPTTQETLDRFVSRIDRLPVLIVITFRPEFRPPWIGQANVTALTLNRLRSDDCTQLVRALTAHCQLSDKVVADIAKRTDGVPLFAEELSSAVIDAGGAALSKRGFDGDLEVPATLHASLIARLDRLGAAARETAQAASIIGREFSHSLLTRMVQNSGVLDRQTFERALDALVASGLIFVRRTPPHAVYTFKHSLVQDAAYSTLLRTNRQKLHAALASMMARDDTVAPEVLAYHFDRAGECDQAIVHWFRAGQAANERSANLEAIQSFENALKILDSLPHTRERKLKELEISIALCNPLIVAKWLMPETTQMIERAARLAEEVGVGLPPALLYHRWLYLFGSSHHREALRAAKLFVEKAGPELQTRAHTCLSNSLYMSGASLETALALSARALSAYDREINANQRFTYTYEPRCVALSTQSLQFALRGLFEEAKAAEQEALSYAAEFDHPQTIGMLLAYKLLLGELQGDYSEREKTASALARHAAEHKIVFWSLWADIFTGFAKARGGAAPEGIEMMDRPLQVFAEMKFTYFRPYLLGLKARAYEMADDLDRALASVTEGIAFAEESGERVVLSDLIRIRGELQLAKLGEAGMAAAEEMFTEAIALARAQHSKLHEIRAATSLARLWQGRGKYAEARDMLNCVYTWFGEGLDSPDLLAARAVLDELSIWRPREQAYVS